MTDLFSLRDRTAIVTGASSGLGAHFARVLAGAGANVVLAARRVDRLATLAAELEASGSRAAAVALDVTDPASVAAAFDAGERALGPATIVVNNAGVSAPSYMLKTSEDEWRSIMSVNLDGVFRVGQEAGRRMAKHGTGGSIVNIASILGFMSLRTLGPYSASKAAVVSLTKSMALEFARARVRVNAIAPGYFSTEINAGFLDSPAGKALFANVPMGRPGELAELDGPLLLLASPAGAFMTGSVITVDGGHLLGGG